MKGFVPTPPALVDRMVDKLFAGRPPRPDSFLLDPGCGTGAFIEGVIRWCQRNGQALPTILGLDSDPALLREAKHRIGTLDGVSLVEDDFLTAREGAFDYIIGNPPYVAITRLSAAERERYRRDYQTAVGRFDLYQLFFDQALRLLKPTGRLVFVTPEKFLYVQSAEQLRRALAVAGVLEIELVHERTFEALVTYPAVTTVDRLVPEAGTRIVLRNGTIRHAGLAGDGRSWQPLLGGMSSPDSGHVVADAFVRISCGVATGADGVFVVRNADLEPSLKRFAAPTLSGRSLTLNGSLTTSHQMIMPYSRRGELLPESELGALGEYLRHPERRARLMKRTCVLRKPWYAFHENPPLADILRPKILCKDIGSYPRFVVDTQGEIVPRHSVYYLVPANPSRIFELCDYLNSDSVREHLVAHCQRAANGFLRLQSHVLKRIPLPAHFVDSPQLVCA